MKYLDVKPEAKNNAEDWLRWQNWVTSRLVSGSINRQKIHVVIQNEEDWAFAWIDKDNKKQMAVF